MKLITAFLKLIRSLNLLFIVLTQFLFQYCIIIPSLKKAGLTPNLNHKLFILISLSSVLIAAAGYIINDYFDLNIDRINKPQKVVVERVIKRRWAIFWHLFLSGLGILISFYVGWKNNHNLILGAANLACVFLLWVYSTTFKKKLLSGNIIISILTGWVVLVLYVAEFDRFLMSGRVPELTTATSKIFKLSILYGGFAFISSLVREVIKDIEDMPGDMKYNCRTMPIVWGINASKVFIATWLVVLIASLSILQVYVLPYKWWWSIIYAVVLIILPIAIVFFKLFSAKTTEHYHALSNWMKFIILAGIISMVFFFIYD